MLHRLRLHLLSGILALAGCITAAQAQGLRGEIIGVTIEPGEKTTRVTVRVSVPVRPSLSLPTPEKAWIELPDTAPGSLPAELPVDASGVESLKVRRGPAAVWLELVLTRPLSVKLLPPSPSREVVIEISSAAPAVQGELFSRPAGGNTLTPRLPDAITEAEQDAAIVGPPRSLLPVRRPGAPLTPAVPPGRPGPARLGPTRLVKASFVSSGARMQLRLETTGACAMRCGYLPGASPRCFVDVEGAVFAGIRPPSVPNNPYIQAVRFGQNSVNPPITRIVMELKPGTSEAEFLPAGFDPAILIGPDGRTPPVLRPELPEGPVSPVDPELGKGFVIAVDAGHGGGDPGASGPDGLQEKQITLDVALRLSRWLRERGCQVKLSRRSDSSLPPPLRTAWITQTTSHVLVSIHCDAVAGRPNVTGATTYFHQAQSTCRALAEKVQRSLVRSTAAPDLGVRSDYTRYDRGFYLLRSAARPAVLVETGYISHAPTARLLANPEYRQKIAEGVGEGVLAFLSERMSRK